MCCFLLNNLNIHLINAFDTSPVLYLTFTVKISTHCHCKNWADVLLSHNFSYPAKQLLARNNKFTFTGFIIFICNNLKKRETKENKLMIPAQVSLATFPKIY